MIYGIFMMKKNKDFSHIETATQFFKYYIYILLSGCVLFALYYATTLGAYERYDRKLSECIASASLSLIAIFYIIAVNTLFLKPLHTHSKWIEQNGIFSGSAKKTPETNIVDIIKGERLRTFSVADELIKWAKLKEDGHITEQEFIEARKKLLQ